MTLTKLLWGALSGALTIIVLMAGAWAHDTQVRSSIMDQRLSVTEQHYAAIQTDLEDLRDHVKELKEMLRDEKANHVR